MKNLHDIPGAATPRDELDHWLDEDWRTRILAAWNDAPLQRHQRDYVDRWAIEPDPLRRGDILRKYEMWVTAWR